MEHHPNQNGFTWKRMKPTACITAQYKTVTMMDFKVKEGAENMLIPGTVGSFISMKSNLSKVLCNRAVPQKSTKDGCKDDEIAVDTRIKQ